MRYDSVIPFNFTYDYYEGVVDGEEVTYELVRADQKAIVSPAAGGMYLYTKEALAVGGQIRNLKDGRGTSMLLLNGVERPYYVHSAAPEISVFSEVVGWKHLVKDNVPRDALDLLRELAASNNG